MYPDRGSPAGRRLLTVERSIHMNRPIRQAALLLTTLLMTISMAACSGDPAPAESGIASPEPGSAALALAGLAPLLWRRRRKMSH